MHRSKGAGTPLLLLPLVASVLLAAGGTPASAPGDDGPGKGTPSAAAAGEVGPSSSPGHQQMLGILAHIARISSDDNRMVGDFDLRWQLAALQRMPPNAPMDQRLNASFSVASQFMRLGKLDECLSVLHAARKLIPLHPQPKAAEAELDFRLGVAWLRKGEVSNCIQCRTGESCVYPISPAGVHKDQEGSQKAAEQFLEVLKIAPPDSSLYLRARWLLNVAHMTLGTYPDGVPPVYRVDAKAIGGDTPFPAFPNVAPEMGLDLVQLAGSAIVDDFDGDGVFDVVTSTSDPREGLRFFHGVADGQLEDQTAAAGLEGMVGGGLHLTGGDYDNDGDLDFVVPRGAWLQENGRRPTSLVRNDGDDHFTDVSFDAGLQAADYPSQVAAWADYDNDGDLDLFLGGEANVDHPYPCLLYRNDGDGTFTERGEAAGVTNMRYTKGAAWADVDGDRLPDLYVSNLGGPNRLYHNNGDGTFTDVASQLGVQEPIQSFACWFWDFDNDGALDLFVSSFEEDVSSFVAARLGMENQGDVARLYRGDGKGHFADAAKSCGISLPMVSMGAGFGDLDNDGYLDMYLGTGFPSYEGLVPNLLYHNVGGKLFENVTAASRMGILQKGHGVSFVDIDRDGDEDIYARLGGAFLADRFASALFQNPGFGNEWISVRCIGSRSNRGAFGARVHATLIDAGVSRGVWRWVGQGSSFGNDPLELHLGLGKATKVDALEVYWPTTDTTQVFHDLPARARVEITEDQPEPRILPQHAKLGGE